MNYIMIRTDDMLNGDGLRVVLFLSACNHYCDGCHNPETWDPTNGTLFDDKAKEDLFKELSHDYISGITLSGGDPLYPSNRFEVKELISEIKSKFPSKNVWLYTGYTWDKIMTSHEMRETILQCDVVVDGMFQKDLVNVNYPWAGSTNQRVINAHKSLEQNTVILWENINDKNK